MVRAEDSGQERHSECKESRTFLNIKHTVLTGGKYCQGRSFYERYWDELMRGLNRINRVGMCRHQLQFMVAVMM